MHIFLFFRIVPLVTLKIFKRELMQSYAPVIETGLQPTELAPDSVGKTLNRIRLKQGHSLEDVTKSTKIRTHFLMLLEEDNFNDLPGTVFTTGFIRNYCEYLNISAAPLISQYAAQCSKKETETPFKVYIPQKSEKIITTRVIFISIFIIFISSALWHITQNNNIFNISEIINSNDIAPQEAKQKKEQLSKKNPINSQAEKKLSEPATDAENVSKPKNDLPTARNESISTEPSALIEKTPTLESKDFNIEATEETWLKITNDQGVRLKVSFLKKGEVFSLKPYQGNLISVGNAENVEFIQGDTRIKGSEYLGTMSGFAESKKIVVPQTSDVVQSIAPDMSKSTPVL